MEWTLEVVVLPVSDIDAAAARQHLIERGVEVSELAVITEADGGTFFGFQCSSTAACNTIGSMLSSAWPVRPRILTL